MTIQAREIKFRALMRDSMTGKTQWQYYGIGGKPALLGNRHAWVVEDLQFTGLYDKSGVAIYEHDLIKYGNDAPTEVVWKQGGFSFMNTEMLLGRFDLNVCEVIGNIHQNPELLEAV